MPDAPIPAATLVIFRERADAPPDILMVERAKAMVFAGGAWVFPGGRIDPGDHALALTFAGDPDDLAARVAAVRETVEEVGLPIGLVPAPDPAMLTALRAALHAGTAFGEALADAGLTLDIAALVPFARWLPDHPGMRIFDTRFYLVRLPTDAPEAAIDATENTRLRWASAAEVLALADAGEAFVIFPTRRNLERLAQYASFAAAVADAAAHPVETITPFVEERGGIRQLCIPAHLGYPVTAEPLADTFRA
ncbi:MAG: NUDIX domain-containing protein [Pseudomonadota bacterium]